MSFAGILDQVRVAKSVNQATKRVTAPAASEGHRQALMDSCLQVRHAAALMIHIEDSGKRSSRAIGFIAGQ